MPGLTMLALGATLLFGQPQPTGCTFHLGFAALDALIPTIVGDCVDDETFDPTTGDAQQLTTNGLLVWRKEDNWTAFTDGSQTWLNGPFGLQQRANAERLWWEYNPDGLPIVPPPTDGDRCHTAGLVLDLVGVDVGAGNRYATFRFTNTLDVSCTFFGYPGAQLFDAAGDPLPTKVVRGGGFFPDRPARTVLVGAHQSASFVLHWEVVPVNDEPPCPMSASLSVTPPDEYDPLPLAMQIQACGGGELDVSPVQPDAAG